MHTVDLEVFYPKPSECCYPSIFSSLTYRTLDMEQEVISLSEAEESLDEAGAPGPHSDDDIAIDDPGEFATTEEYLAVSRANPTDITRVHILTFF